MCIIIDANTFSKVLNPKDAEHHKFKPVHNWICNGDKKGKKPVIVYGGTKCLAELKKCTKYWGYILELKTRHKAVTINRDLVDNATNELDKIVPKDCNDSHIIALAKVSGCKIVCSCDKKSHTHIKNKRYYYHKQTPPFIYSEETDKKYLTSRNIVDLANIES